MSGGRKGCSATFGVGALALVLLACGGCARHGALRWTVVRAVEDEYVRLTVHGEPWGDGPQPGLLCTVTVENVSDGLLTICDSGGLPEVLHVPPDGVGVFYGVVPAPTYREIYGVYAFPARTLPPGGRYRYAVVLANPLREEGIYGNPAYDDPRSPYYVDPFRRMEIIQGKRPPDDPPHVVPDELRWRHWRVRVGYFPFDVCRPCLDWLAPDDEVEYQGRQGLLIDFQREISVAGTLGGPGRAGGS